MERRPLGGSGLSATPVGLGLAAAGRPAYITLGRKDDLPEARDQEAMRSRSHQLLDAAYRMGVRYFDVARSYGLAEQFLSSWLRAREPLPEPVTCGSKWGYEYVGEWRMDAAVHEVKDHSLGALRRQLPQSLELLGDHLQLYQIHSATLESGVLEDKAVLSELARLGRRGLAIGLSVSGPHQSEVIERALAVRVDGETPFTAVQATWNLLETSAGPALAAAHEQGWGVLVKEALANGRLVSGPRDQMGPLVASARAYGVGLDSLAIAAALAQPWADVVLSGAVTVGQLESNLAGVEVQLEERELEGLLGLAEPSQRYWSERQAMPWS
jgi:aryl-alcohol dehydrogenase-like predicted oxidoreductase